MGFDLLSLGSQAVLTAQRQLQTTGHNISNVNTEGYSRQIVEQATDTATYWAGNNYGNGVHVASVHRNYDQFAVNEYNISTSTLANAAATNRQLDFLDDMLSNSAKTIPDNMNEFFNAVSSMADTPNDMGARQVVLEQAKLVTSSLNDTSHVLQQQEIDNKTEINASLLRMNAIAHEIVDANLAIIKSQGVNNDLLDRRDELISQLSEFTQVTVTERTNGTINVLMGTGHTLVSGTQVSQLALIAGKPDTQEPQLALLEGQTIKPISHDGMRGKLGALFDYRNTTLAQTRDQFGRLAAGFSLSINELQSQGLDLNGAIGNHFFSDFNSERFAADRIVSTPDSTADLKVYIDDLSLIRNGDYQLSFNGTDYTLYDPSGQQRSISISGTPPSFDIDGLRVQIDQGLSAGETILIRPFRQAAGQIQVVMENPEEIAAQNYINANSKISGTGNVLIEQSGAQTEFEILISGDGLQFSVHDLQGNELLAPQAYPPTSPVTVNGTRFELTDGAAPNDRFSLSLVPADGENGNLLLMQDLRLKKIMDQGRATLLDVYEALNTDIGIKKAANTRLMEVTMIENNAAAGRVAEVSGVNLDQEASNLMQFQQAYMASSRIMSAADEAFKTLLSVTR